MVSGHLQMTSTKKFNFLLWGVCLQKSMDGFEGHCFILCMHVLSCFSCVGLCATPWTIACRLLSPWDSPGKNIGVGCHALIQGIFLTQGSNWYLLCLLHWQVGSLSLSHSGSLFYLIGTLSKFSRTLRSGIDKRGEAKDMGNSLDL